jgi:predicted nucleic acid-binding protein
VATLVFDASPLSHFARANHVHTLRQITGGHRCTVTQAVLDEISAGANKYPELGNADLTWLEVVPVDGLPAMQVFVEYARVLGSGTRDIGEATTLTFAELHGAIAIVDEAAGREAGRARGATVHGTLWLVAEAFRATLLSEADTVALVNQLRAAEAWFPCDGEKFLTWARAEGLL